MATQQRTIAYLIEQANGAGTVSAKPMFGEYGVYVDGKMIGSVCDRDPKFAVRAALALHSRTFAHRNGATLQCESQLATHGRTARSGAPRLSLPMT
jgi:hypothetical protein